MCKDKSTIQTNKNIGIFSKGGKNNNAPSAKDVEAQTNKATKAR